MIRFWRQKALAKRFGKQMGACARVRDAVIGFPAHGAWRQVEAAMAARDVPAGESWTFENHRTMAEVIAEETTAA
jgi:hypothetical protein